MDIRAIGSVDCCVRSLPWSLGCFVRVVGCFVIVGVVVVVMTERYCIRDEGHSFF